MLELIGALIVTGLWLAVLIGDLRLRRVAIPVLLGLLFVSLLGQPWPWWLITGATILLPSRWIVSLVPLVLGVGLLTNDLAVGLATALGIWAWVMKWWAGADAIVLVALTLRAGWMGLVTGLVVVLVTAIVVFLKRRQAPAMLLFALDEAVRVQPRLTTEIPSESELPAAAALAFAGIVAECLQVVALVTTR
jgi:hypothetical protein